MIYVQGHDQCGPHFLFLLSTGAVHIYIKITLCSTNIPSFFCFFLFVYFSSVSVGEKFGFLTCLSCFPSPFQNGEDTANFIPYTVPNKPESMYMYLIHFAPKLSVVNNLNIGVFSKDTPCGFQHSRPSTTTAQITNHPFSASPN